MDKVASRLYPAIDAKLFALAFAAAIVVVGLLTFVPVSENDLLIQIKVGESIWQQHQIPATLVYPFTEARDFAFHAHEWLPSIVFYLLDRALGLNDLLFVQGAIGIGLFVGCYALAVRLNGDRATSLLLAVLTLAVSNYRFHLRPELFALAYVLLTTWLLVEFRRSRKPVNLFGVGVVYLFWINSHGSFPVALVLVGLFAVGEAIDAYLRLRNASWFVPASLAFPELRNSAGPFALALAGMLVLSGLNPEGYQLLLFPFTLSESAAVMHYIGEWRPTFSLYFMVWPPFYLYLLFVVFVGVVLFKGRKKIGATEWLVVMAFFALSTTRNRHIVFFAYASLFALAMAVRAPATTPTTPMTTTPTPIPTPAPSGVRVARRRNIGVLAALLLVIPLEIIYGNLYGAYPYVAPNVWLTEFTLERMEKAVEGPILNSMEFGGEIIYRFYPRIRPGIDSRIDSFGDRYFTDWQNMYKDEVALNRFIARHDIRFMLLMPHDFATVREMPTIKTGWKMMWSDHKSVLIRR